MGNVNYTFLKGLDKATVFDYIRTKLSADDKRVLILNISKDSPSTKFQILQKDDLLISRSDYLAKIQENILVVDDTVLLDGTAVEVTTHGLSKMTFSIDEFLSGEKFLFLGRAEKVGEEEFVKPEEYAG